MNYRKFIAIVLSVTLAWAGFSTAAVAAVVGTADALGMEQRGARLAAVQAGLARSDVQQAMVQLGVDPLQAQLRVAALSEQELAQLQGQLDQLPAGGVLELIGAVFLVLLILELTGVIDIFKKA
ncbi:MAG: PA2779 family protein [Halioglobus sp.]|jgi:hypothetical protein|nr:PA2779 family protein [Halioglobus sp.]